MATTAHRISEVYAISRQRFVRSSPYFTANRNDRIGLHGAVHMGHQKIVTENHQQPQHLTVLNHIVDWKILAFGCINTSSPTHINQNKRNK
jgi:hypothetical protein